MMKNSLRFLLYLTFVVWLGGEIFFPITAAVSFETLSPHVAAAGAIVGHLIRILHQMGLVAGLLAVILLALARRSTFGRPRAALVPMALLVAMLAATAYSQYHIIPAMERDRIAAGGVIHASDTGNPYVRNFNSLHRQSVWLEETITLLGLISLGLVVRADSPGR